MNREQCSSVRERLGPRVPRTRQNLAEFLRALAKPIQHKTMSLQNVIPGKHPRVSTSAAGLNYRSADTLRIRRHRKGRGFLYEYPRGHRVRNAAVLERIQSLAIPPAWTDVFICDHPKGHLQAVGRDARGRKQYRYHTKWRQRRDHEKFERLIDFARVLPRIRRRVQRDLRQSGLTRSKALAAIVRLLERSRIRVGNEEYARQNQSFGLTTLRNRHVCVRGHTMRFQFRGKSGKHHAVQLRDRRLARVVVRCLAVPGEKLFQYLDESGRRHRVTAGEVTEYLRDITGKDFTAKDFRTWAGTVLAARALRARPGEKSAAQARQEIRRAVCMVAERLGNTPAICRKSYIHPAVIDAYLAGAKAASNCNGTNLRKTCVSGLRIGEAEVVRLLQRRPART